MRSNYDVRKDASVLVQDAAGAGVTAEYRGLILRSVFQPIGSVVHGNVLGYEALIRVTTPEGELMAPPVAFKEAEDAGELLLLNQIVTDIHLANFSCQDPGDCWLFLNINTPVLLPMITQSGNLSQIAARHRIAPARIVIEVLEQDVIDNESFDLCLRQYKEAGFMVAMDDFGKGWSNLDRILNFFPSIVKFDLSLVAQGRANQKVQRAYRHLTLLLHEVGIMVLAEGIESVGDASFMVEAGVDFLQGYWLARPHPSTRVAQVADRIHELRTVYGERAFHSDQVEYDIYTKVEQALRRASEVYAATGDISRAAAVFHAMPCARRLVVLDQDGFDVGAVSADAAVPDSGRRAQLGPLLPGRNSRFTHRKYFRDALRSPDQVHFASPVYSLIDGASSDVAAKAVNREGRLFVLCGVYLRY